MKGFVAFVLCLSLISVAHGKVYERCELARTLLNTYGFSRSTLGDWVCLVKHESSYNTAAKGGPNGGSGVTSGSYDWGLFQVNDYYWCYISTNPAYNDCNVNCANLLDDSIADDVACAKKIHGRHGFDAWYGWINNCKGTNTESWVSDCGV
ncbi:lysozyme c-1-like [Artemia franciscana]|uniref:lysozyme n=1 Tax=Artemia franciscana TaxID=6661 RepID=A0AA88KY49_ARTSF|nr:hypothetical protein QYM36_016462 [Artemia franciscana]